jgi:hypothetical protein
MKNDEKNYKKIEKTKIDEQIKRYENVFSETKSKRLSEMKDNSIQNKYLSQVANYKFRLW